MSAQTIEVNICDTIQVSGADLRTLCQIIRRLQATPVIRFSSLYSYQGSSSPRSGDEPEMGLGPSVAHDGDKVILIGMEDRYGYGRTKMPVAAYGDLATAKDALAALATAREKNGS